MIFRNNIDYEYSLFDPFYKVEDPKYQKLVNNFEYVYFFLQSEPSILFTQVPGLYSDDYFSYLESLNFTIPKLSSKVSHYENWWGDLKNKELSQFLNSKLTSTQLAMKKGWAHPLTTIVKDDKEIENYLQKHGDSFQKFVIKSPYFMSGRGMCWTDQSNSQIRQKWYGTYKNFGPFIIEPHLDIAMEFGIYFNPDNDSPAFHQNFVTSQGIYRGCLIYQNERNQISNKLIEQILLNSNEIAQEYKKMGAIKGFGIDAFIYRDQGESYPYSLGEVNYRKSMGLMIHALKKFIPKGGVGSWTFFSKKKVRCLSSVNCFHELLKKVSIKEHKIIMTSPPKANFPSFFFAATTLEEHNLLHDQFYRLLKL